ncbi:MAG: recombinase, partial [Muribaculaceae bacterium]|nr:recombinase [Muribaculaceae bacterium]
MSTLSAVIVPAKVLKDGRHKVRISIAHNGETRYIVTDITIDSVKEFRNGMIVRRSDAAFMNTKLRSIIQHYQEVMYEIQYAEGLTCSELVELLKQSKNRK